MRFDSKIYGSVILKKDVFRSLSKFLTVILIVLFSTAESHSTASLTIRLFNENGSPVSDYNQQIKNIIEAVHRNQVPLNVQFSRGLTLKVYTANHGAQNLVMGIGNGRVIRVRLFKYTPFRFWNGLLNPPALVDSLGNYILGNALLEKNGVPVPKINIVPGHEKEFLLTEKINIQFSYADYIKPEFTQNVSSTELSKIDSDFLEFVRKTAKFRKIGDFGSKQLVYSKDKGWVLLDFSNKSEMAHARLGGNIFEFDQYDKLSNNDSINSHFTLEIIHKPGLPKRIKDKVLAVIVKEREKQWGRNRTKPVNVCYRLFGF